MKVELIRTDGTREWHEISAKGASARIKACYRLMGCEVSDTVNLKDGRIMLVDDDGWEIEEVRETLPGTFARFPVQFTHVELRPIRPKPGKMINSEATRIYHSVCRRPEEVKHQIVGDVVVCWDEDFTDG